ncbi:MAG: L-seryl-tRNA(Sec) selenium transferase [bacterium]
MTSAQTELDPRRLLPSVDAVLQDEALSSIRERIAPEFVTQAIRLILERERVRVREGELAPDAAKVAKSAAAELQSWLNGGLHSVINGTGIILHTGLGRAPLAPEAQEAIRQVAKGYCNLEIDLPTGRRGERQNLVLEDFRRLLGVEAALVVNNNAAGVFLVLSALAFKREVIVSRGQLIEIGGSFRLPEIMKRSGAKLVEVGTTNKTRLADYADAITPKTGLILRAYPSNYKIQGFAQSVPLSELVALGREHGLPVVDDLGGGLLWSWQHLGLPEEPTVSESLEAGVDLVLFSGDKTLGGPQTGIIVGKEELIARLRRHPLLRVLRPDKLQLAALSATVKLFLDREHLPQRLPVFERLCEPVASLRERAATLKERIENFADWTDLEIVETKAQTGSGTLPADELPSAGLAFCPRGMRPHVWARHLRLANPAVLGIVKDERFILDFRTVFPWQTDVLAHAIESALTKGSA